MKATVSKRKGYLLFQIWLDIYLLQYVT